MLEYNLFLEFNFNFLLSVTNFIVSVTPPINWLFLFCALPIFSPLLSASAPQTRRRIHRNYTFLTVLFCLYCTSMSHYSVGTLSFSLSVVFDVNWCSSRWLKLAFQWFLHLLNLFMSSAARRSAFSASRRSGSSAYPRKALLLKLCRIAVGNLLFPYLLTVVV